VPTVGTVCGYAVFGTIGAAYGLAISATVVSTVMWSRLRRHIKGGGADRLVPT